MNFLRCMAILDWCGLSLHHNRRKICCSVCRSQVIIIIFNGIFLTIFIFWICLPEDIFVHNQIAENISLRQEKKLMMCYEFDRSSLNGKKEKNERMNLLKQWRKEYTLSDQVILS